MGVVVVVVVANFHAGHRRKSTVVGRLLLFLFRSFVAGVACPTLVPL